MKELEDTKCEVRRTIDLPFSIWDRSNACFEEDGIASLGLPGYSGCTSPLGNFFKDAAYAWLSCGPRLVVIDVKTGAGISSWTFRDRVTCVSEFPAEPGQIPLLLVGLDQGQSRARDSFGLVCVFDCTSAQVLRAIRMPAGVEQACVVIGGAEWEDSGERTIQDALAESSGIACVALRNLDTLMIDLRRSSWEATEARTLYDETSPAELNFTECDETASTRHGSGREKHAVYNLMNSRLERYIGFNREEFETSSIYQEPLTSSLLYSRKIGCLVVSCLGRIIIWQTDGEVRWISAPLDEGTSITHLSLLEPTDDPRPFCYLWSAYQEETCRSPPILRMHAMLFERKYTEKGANTYFNLESDPSVKFELELEDNERITSLCPVVRDSNPEQTDSTYKRGEDSILLINLETRTILFDLNQWYKEQMPQTIVDCTNPNAIVANYRTRSEIRDIAEDTILSSIYVPETLSEFPCSLSTPSEELFYPNSLSIEWIDLSTSRLTFWATRGLQAELLRDTSISGPVVLIEPTETFNRCVAAGLVATSSDRSINTDKDRQREILLSLFLEQRWSKFLLKCAKEWSDGSASYLFHAFLRWSMQRASAIKLEADRLSVPLYDQSGTGIGEAEVKQLRFCCQQLECITKVVENLEIDSVDLTKERRALRRVSTYLQVLSWFYDVGLLPETQEIEEEEEEATLPVSFSLKIPFPYEKLAAMYREKRQEFGRRSTKNSTEQEEDMFIDELVTRECAALKSQWEREGGELRIGGYYPPSSLQSLLRSYLTDCHNSSDAREMDNKHQITIYLLMDLAMLLQNSCPNVNQLIKYPSAFKLSPSLIKLTQALWLLDHEDYHGFLEIMTGQLVSDSDVKDWHHRLVMRTLIRNNKNKLALIYLRVRKPPLSSLDDQSTVIGLSVEHGLVQSAFHQRPASHYAQLLESFYRACKKYNKLNDILHLALDHEEENIFVKFLESEKIDDTRLLYYLQRCRYSEASNVCPKSSGATSRAAFKRNHEKSGPLMIFDAYNTTLPRITRKFSANIAYKGTNVDSTSRYPRPMSHAKSRIDTSDIHQHVMKKARETFLRCDRRYIPFISAPCSSSTSHSGNVETSSVLYVEKLKRIRAKRSLDEMRADDSTHVDNEDDRKRRRIDPSSGRRENDRDVDRELCTGIVFQTPLVKRKNKITSARSSPIETPHSILKIRQLIRDSTSPCLSEDSSRNRKEENIQDRERKRRQIRFSLRQFDNDEDVTGDTKNDEVETTEDRDEIDVSAATETQKNSDGHETSEEEVFEEAYYSPNFTGKSYYEPTLLTDASNLSINVSGPRPRPSLRGSDESATYDLRRKSLNRTTNPAADSTRISSELSFTANASSKNNEKSFAAMGADDVLSETAYTASILSSDTSFERTLPTKWTLPSSIRETSHSFSFSRKSLEKCRDLSSLALRNTEKTENFQTFDQGTTRRSSIARSKGFEDQDNLEEDKNSVVLMEIDGFGLDQESSNQSTMRNTWDTDSCLDRTENMATRNITETSIIVGGEKLLRRKTNDRETCKKDEEMEKNPNDSLSEVYHRFAVPENDEINVEIQENEEAADEDEDNEQDEELLRERKNDGVASEGIGDDSEKRKTSSLGRSEVETDETDQTKTCEDYDDELLALRYEDDDEDEDNDEVYQSLSNSANIVTEASKSLSEKSIIPSDGAEEAIQKSINNGFYDIPRILNEHINMTDDESSRSVDGSALSVDSARTKENLDKTVSIDKIEADLMNEDSNMTNDDSSTSFDSSLFSLKKPSQHLSKVTNSFVDVERTSTDCGTSNNSSSFSLKKQQSLSGNSEKIFDTVQGTESNKKSSISSSSTAEALSSEATENKTSEMNNESDGGKEIEEPRVKASPRPKREKRLIRKIDIPKGPESPAVDPGNTTPLRMTRSRRASSVAQEQSPMPESPVTRSSTAGRLRRASSLATDIFPSVDPKLSNTLEIKVDPKASRLRRSVSLMKELTPLKSRIIEEEALNREEQEVEATPVGRRTRRATSVQKDTSVSTRTKVTRSSSKVSLAGDEVEEPSTSRKTTRAKKTASKDTDTSIVVKRLTRATSLVKELPDTSDDATISTRRTTRKRGTSVPKETTMETSTKTSSQRSKRGGSVAKDVIREEPRNKDDDTKDEKETPASGTEKMVIERTRSTSPTTSTRSRLSSITSIPEEMEDEKEVEDKESDDEIFTWRGKPVENKKNTRLRRAASVDLPQVPTKRRTRAVVSKKSIIDEPIEEETTGIDGSSENRNKPTKKAPVRRKRTTSATSLREGAEVVILEKLPMRRTRNLSQKSDDGETFRFSPPGKIHGRPDDDDEKATGEVPEYVFSPPHTRSKHNIPPPRRKVNRDFIPLTEKERAAGKLAMEGFVVARAPIRSNGPSRDPFLLYGPRKVFSFPKRSKSLSDDLPRSSETDRNCLR